MSSTQRLPNTHFSHLFKRWSSGICLLSVLCIPTRAQERHLKFEHLTSADGLSHSTITAIVQDQLGFLWLGTLDGLNRYDGYEIIVYKHIPGDSQSLTDSTIQGIAEENPQYLWIATGGGGLNRLDRISGQFKAFRHDPNDPGTLSSNNPRKLLFDSYGTLWVGTVDGGVCRLDSGMERFRSYRHHPDYPQTLLGDRVTDMTLGSGDKIWVAGNQGISQIDIHTSSIRSISHHTWINGILEDRQGRIWIGANDGLYRLNQQTNKLVRATQHRLLTTRISSLCEDRRGRFWIGTQRNGMIRFERSNGFVQFYKHLPGDSESLSHDDITDIFEDRSGILWIGTNTRWLNKLHLDQQQFRHYRHISSDPKTISHDHVRAIWRDKHGALWIGTKKGLNRHSSGTGGFDHFKPDRGGQNAFGPSGNSIYAFAEDSQSLWIGTNVGLTRYNHQTQSFDNFGRGNAGPPILQEFGVRALTVDRNDTLWVGTKGGGLLSRSKTGSQSVIGPGEAPENLSNGFVYALLATTEGEIWIGTLGGGINRIKTDQQLEIYRAQESRMGTLSHDRVFSLHQDHLGRIWAGTASGLNLYKPETNQFRTFQNMTNPSNTIYAILPDSKDKIWVSTSQGIACFDPQTEQYQFYSTRDGLQSSVFSPGAGFYASDGELYFGGINGYNAFYPIYLKKDPNTPQLAITEIQVDRFPQRFLQDPTTNVIKPVVADGKQWVIPSNSSSVAFSFSGLHYANPKLNRYMYRLEGLQENWVETDAQRRFASFTNLSSGPYTFQVKASNADGIWQQTMVTVPIFKQPTFWETAPAYGLYVLVLIGIIYALLRIQQVVVRRRSEALMQEKLKLEQAVEERTQQLKQAHKELLEVAHQSGMAEIATSVLHNVGNVLNSIAVSGQCVQDTLEGNQMPDRLTRANTMLEEQLEKGIAPGDRKAHELLKYYRLVQTRLKRDFMGVSEDVHRVQEGIQLIKKIVKSQQNYASTGLCEEETTLDRIVRDAISILDASMLRHQVEVHFRGDPNLVLKLPRTKLIHVVLNLIKNAKEAMETTPEKIMTITVEKDHYFGYLRVQDTGIGIPRQALRSIFTHGYTTKSGGHGFGLHSCANALTEMGGTIWAESPGPDKGATFIIKFPRQSVSETPPLPTT